VDQVPWARSTAEAYLAESLPQRWRHVKAVAGRAGELAGLVPGDEELLVSAAWLHDIGYAPALAVVGFHPLDGARFLRADGVDERLCRLVARHSGAVVEAELRGLSDALDSEFADEESTTRDALWFADLTTGPNGERLTVERRLAEIAERYGPDGLVTVAVGRARPLLLAAVERIQERLAS
jgi:putative nucleotidyltransferase with HDIG domain